MQKIKPKPSPIWENKGALFLLVLSFSEKKPRTRVYFDLATETKESKRVVIELLVGIAWGAIMRRTTSFRPPP